MGYKWFEKVGKLNDKKSDLKKGKKIKDILVEKKNEEKKLKIKNELLKQSLDIIVKDPHIVCLSTDDKQTIFQIILDEIHNSQPTIEKIKEIIDNYRINCVNVISVDEKDLNGKDSDHVFRSTGVPSIEFPEGIDSTSDTNSRLNDSKPFFKIEPTQEQKCVIEASAEAMLIVEAGPGSGKTEVVARRLSYLIKNKRLKPGEILVLSFSRSAVRALIQRIRSIDSNDEIIEELRYLSVRTFDSWTFRMLRFLGYEPSKLLLRKHDENIITFNEIIEGIDNEIIEKIKLHKIKHLIVDEYQDLTGIRALLVKNLIKVLKGELLKKNKVGFTILGDQNQAIFDWTMRINESKVIFSSFELKEWLIKNCKNIKEITFTLNHRSNTKITSLTQASSQILKKTYKTGNNPIPEILKHLNENIESNSSNQIIEMLSSNPDDKIAILCRNNSQILNASIELNKNQIQPLKKIHIGAGSPPDFLPAWIAILFYRFTGSNLSKDHFKRIHQQIKQENKLTNCIPDIDANLLWKMLMNFSKESDDETSISMDKLRERLQWPDSLPEDEYVMESDIYITTIHQSKGLEFNHVQILNSGDVEDEQTAHEEGRILYVGISRAKEQIAFIDLDEELIFSEKCFDNKRKRWRNFSPLMGEKKGNTKHLVEIGQGCDIDNESFVSIDIYQDKEHVEFIQHFLSYECNELLGKEVVLKKIDFRGVDKKVYQIWLNNFKGKDYLLGITTPQLTLDLNKIKLPNQSLPNVINGLKICNITTVIGKEPFSHKVPEPWSLSKIWLGVIIHGTADFYMNKWNAWRG